MAVDSISKWSAHLHLLGSAYCYHRKIGYEKGVYTVNGVPLKFYHFSGYSPDHPEQISKHQNRYSFKDQPLLKALFEGYAECLSGQWLCSGQRLAVCV